MESVPAIAVFVLVSAIYLVYSVSGEEIDAAVTESFPSLPVHLLPPAYAPNPQHHHHHHHHHHRPDPGDAPSPHVKPDPHKPPHAVAPAPAPHRVHHHPKLAPYPAPTLPPPSYPSPPTYHVPPPPPHVHPGHHPILPPRSFIAAQGVVYCKPCKFAGVGTLLEAVPLHEAEVELQCNNSKYRPVTVNAFTDAHGYFYVDAPKTVTSFGAHRCRVFFKAVPSKSACANITDLHGGLHGAPLLRLEKPHLEKPPIGAMPPKLLLFSVGPFAAEPGKCPR